MFELIWALANEGLKNKGYTEQEATDALYALKHLDWRFVLSKRKENKERLLAK